MIGTRAATAMRLETPLFTRLADRARAGRRDGEETPTAFLSIAATACGTPCPAAASRFTAMQP
jgi:hypothetical protein